jgi:hypothetical protein
VQKLREEILKEEESEVVNTNEVDAEGTSQFLRSDLRYNQLRPVEEEPQWNY